MRRQTAGAWAFRAHVWILGRDSRSASRNTTHYTPAFHLPCGLMAITAAVMMAISSHLFGADISVGSIRYGEFYWRRFIVF
jgi:hypothetical protein